MTFAAPLQLAWLGLLWLALGAVAARRRAKPAARRREEAEASAWRRLTATLAISAALGLLLVYAPLAAIREACLLRFRPIMMTTMAAIMGVLPIAIGHGASAELRQPLGIVVVGGLLVSQLLTLFITPVLYTYMEDLSQALGRLFRRRAEAGATAAAEGSGASAG